MKQLVSSFMTQMFTSTAKYGDSAPANPSLQMTQLDPGEYTIQFSAEAPSDGFGYFANAIVNWKVNGQQNRRAISVLTGGASISGVAESVDVQIQDFSGYAINEESAASRATPQLYKVFATLSRGTRPNVQQPAILQTSVQNTAPVNSSSDPILIPQDAGVVGMYVTIAPSAATGFSPYDYLVSATSVGMGLQSYFPLVQNGWIPMAPGATVVQIINRNITVPADFTILWGIDG